MAFNRIIIPKNSSFEDGAPFFVFSFEMFVSLHVLPTIVVIWQTQIWP